MSDGQSSSEVSVPCLDPAGRLCGLVFLVPARRRPDGIRVLALDEARRYGEERVQLLEGQTYDFELRGANADLRLRADRVVRPSAIRPSLGQIDTGCESGLLPLILEDGRTGKAVARGAVEIVSTKLDYRRDYREMLGFIAAECGQLLFDVRSATQLRLAPEFKTAPANLQRQFEFLETELQCPRFVAALQRVLAQPHQRLTTCLEQGSPGQAGRGRRELARQLSRPGPRALLPGDHPLAQTLRLSGGTQPSLPRSLVLRRHVDSRDTAENRFVKHVLSQFRDTLQAMDKVLRQNPDPALSRLQPRVRHLISGLNHHLSAGLFKELSPLRMLPLGSPALQRQAGYRDILHAWLKFDLAAELVWEGGADVYGAGKRDLATLYEYWVFFQLLRLLREKFELAAPPAKTLFQSAHGGLSLRLRAQEPLGFTGRCWRHSRRLNFAFHYNLRQPCSPTRSLAGSWSRGMRPDFTLSFWPEDYSREEAEARELMVHLHFDAKYRLERLRDIFGGDGEAADDPAGVGEDQGNYQRGDLLKMHAYRDAIRRSAGAYILYPGASGQAPTTFQGFHEVLPGLGAFALKPGEAGRVTGLEHLSRFLDEVVAHICNRVTARERAGYHHFRVYGLHESVAAGPAHGIFPERDDSSAGRPAPPDEHFVLVGWCAGPEHWNWIQSTGLYNFRAGSRRGSLRLEPAIAAARHLLLHGQGRTAWPGLWRITTAGPRIFTAAELLRRGYPGTPDPEAIYAVFDVAPDSAYLGWDWDYPRLPLPAPQPLPGPASAAPFTTTLLQILALRR